MDAYTELGDGMMCCQEYLWRLSNWKRQWEAFANLFLSVILWKNEQVAVLKELGLYATWNIERKVKRSEK